MLLNLYYVQSMKREEKLQYILQRPNLRSYNILKHIQIPNAYIRMKKVGNIYMF